jgi:hypothetical protein
MKPFEIFIFTDVYCSSSGHHVIRMTGFFGGKYFDLDISSSELNQTFQWSNRWGDKEWSFVPRNKYPAYFYAALADKLASIKPDEWTFHEYDQHGNKRYEELRYHHRPSFDGLLEWAIRYIRNYNKQEDK